MDDDCYEPTIKGMAAILGDEHVRVMITNEGLEAYRVAKRSTGKVQQKRIERVLRWLQSYYAKHGVPPTVREMASSLPFHHSTLWSYLKKLVADGRVRQHKGHFVPQ